MLDIFNDDAFTLISLTGRINDLPYRPGQISASGLFHSDGIDTTIVALEKRQNDIGLVGLTPRGGPGETIGIKDDALLYFPVPHFQRDDAMMADEVQGRRAFGTNELDTILNRLDRKVQRHLGDFDTTLEHQRVGAIKGYVTDKFGNIYLNLFQTFGIAPPEPIVFPFSVAAARTSAIYGDIAKAARALRIRMEDSIDITYTGVDAWCGASFFQALIDLPEVRGTYLNQTAAAELRGARNIDAADTLDYGSIVWHRYRTGRKATAANGNSPFIGDTEARLVIRATQPIFETRFAPADYNETVNTIGLPRYMRMRPRRDDKGMEIEVQMNSISYCTRPETLFSVTMG